MCLVLFWFTGCIIQISDDFINQRTWLHENFRHLVITDADVESNYPQARILSKSSQLSLCSNVLFTNNVNNAPKGDTKSKNDH